MCIRDRLDELFFQQGDHGVAAAEGEQTDFEKGEKQRLEAFDLLRRSVMFHGQSLLSFILHTGKPGVNSGEKRDFVSSGFTIRPKGGILYPYHSKICLLYTS